MPVEVVLRGDDNSVAIVRSPKRARPLSLSTDSAEAPDRTQEKSKSPNSNRDLGGSIRKDLRRRTIQGQYVTVTKMGGYRRRHGQRSPAGNLTKCWRQT